MARDFQHSEALVNQNSEIKRADYSGMASRPVPTFSKFSERLAWWIEERGVRKGDFAKKAGISGSALSELLAGRSNLPSADALLGMADALNLRPTYLATGKGAAEGANFQELSGPEAQLVMIFRQLPTDGLRDALLIDANNLLTRSISKPHPAPTPSVSTRERREYERLTVKPKRDSTPPRKTGTR